MSLPCAPALVIAAPASGSGKTVLTLGILRALQRRGVAAGSFKVGPDYIDPAFHSHASGAACVNLDPWGMSPAQRHGLLQQCGQGRDIIIGEGVMGLFDGAAGGGGSTADLSRAHQIPVVFVVDASRQGQSIAALVHGFHHFHKDLRIAGIIANRVGSARHGDILRSALGALAIPLLGLLPSDDALALPSRHLGLVQADEHSALESFLDRAADHVAEHLDLEALCALAAMPTGASLPQSSLFPTSLFPTPGQHIAIARDEAFSFIYPHLLFTWRVAGAHLSFFSPLAGEVPDGTAEMIFLPGGYPELHCRALCEAAQFKTAMQQAAATKTFIYGECGGYMVLGQHLIDGAGQSWPMLGLLPHSTSFAQPRRTLGYRRLQLLDDGPLGKAGVEFTAHEFHYSSLVQAGPVEALFAACDSEGNDLGTMGQRQGNVCGSYAHLIAKMDRQQGSSRRF